MCEENIEQPKKNTDTEIWRVNLNDPQDPDNAYAPSVHITADGKIGINDCGQVAQMTPAEWIKMARDNAVKITGKANLVTCLDCSKRVSRQEATYLWKPITSAPNKLWEKIWRCKSCAGTTKCGRCEKAILDLSGAECCWYCTNWLCYSCWDEFGHCGHRKADEQNERARMVRQPNYQETRKE